MSEETRDDRYADVDTSHLEDVEDGCGCTEIWEHTSEQASRTEDAPPTERAVDAASREDTAEPDEESEAEADVAD